MLRRVGGKEGPNWGGGPTKKKKFPLPAEEKNLIRPPLKKKGSGPRPLNREDGRGINSTRQLKKKKKRVELYLRRGKEPEDTLPEKKEGQGSHANKTPVGKEKE